MGLLSAFKISSGKSDKKNASKIPSKGQSKDLIQDPTPLKPLKLSLTPVATRSRPTSVGWKEISHGNVTQNPTPEVS
jgi:hypothetical protein